MNAIKKDANKSPFFHVLIISLLAIGLVSLPLEKLFALFMDSYLAVMVGGIVLRCILSIATIIFIFIYGYQRAFITFDFKGLLLVLPAFLVVINNFPIIGVVQGNVEFVKSGAQVVLYIVYCLFVGLFEELAFMGLVFPLYVKITEKYKNSLFFAVLFTALTFSLSHIVNLFGGASIGATAMQLGYTFLIGGMCALSLAFTKNIFIPVILHALFDVGGLLIGGKVGIATGNQWDTITVIITAVLGVLVCAYMVYICLKTSNEKVKSLYE